MPKDPVMLLSYVNLKLRDYYSSLSEMCEDLEANEKEIVEKLSGINYYYDSRSNQFK
ncbi:DUF4250 domain-containing protein [Lachnospiraceae bacterium OttesenSCG-928-E19]|nr:DUF4250 domain-containing protein [Lachnospiraceae bacterium OttesenSCG-928-E19]